MKGEVFDYFSWRFGWINFIGPSSFELIIGSSCSSFGLIRESVPDGSLKANSRLQGFAYSWF